MRFAVTLLACAVASAASAQDTKTYTFIQCTKFDRPEQMPNGRPVTWVVKDNELMQIVSGRYEISDRIPGLLSWPVSFRDDKKIIHNSPPTGRKHDISYFRLVFDLHEGTMLEETYERYKMTRVYGRCNFTEHAIDGSEMPPITD